MNENPYDTLGVPKDADAQAIKQAYRKKANGSHPDKGGVVEEFHAIVLAYSILSDPDKREKYDRTGQTDGATLSKEDRLWSEATKKVTQTFAEVLGQVGEINAERVDLLGEVKRCITAGIRKCNADIHHWEKVVKHLEQVKGRLVCKNENDFLGHWLDSQVDNAKKSIELTKDFIEVCDKSMELVGQYEYDFVRREQQSPFMGRNDYVKLTYS
jgi:curved DNA-binding protein CbpA